MLKVSHNVLPFFVAVFISCGTILCGQEVTAPAHTPPEFKRAAAQFASARAKALEAVDNALKNKGQNGTSKIDSLVGNVSDLATPVKRNIATVLGATRRDWSEDQLAAMNELVEIYKAQLTPIENAAASANEMLEIHQSLFGLLLVIDMEKDNSIVRRRKCEIYATEITGAVDQAVSSRAADVLSGGDAHKALTLVNGLIKALQGKEVLAETLDYSVESEKRDLKQFLAENDPKERISRIDKAENDSMSRASRAWATYHDRWHSSLESHVDKIDAAYKDFESTVHKPWLDLYKTYAAAKLEAFQETGRNLLGSRLQIEQNLDTQEQEEEEQRQELEEQIEDLEEEIEENEEEVERTEKLVEITEEQIEDESEEDKKDDFEEDLDEFEKLLDELNEKSEAMEKTLDELEEQFKK